jgi:hypothetical protein
MDPRDLDEAERLVDFLQLYRAIEDTIPVRTIPVRMKE